MAGESKSQTQTEQEASVKAKVNAVLLCNGCEKALKRIEDIAALRMDREYFCADCQMTAE